MDAVRSPEAREERAKAGSTGWPASTGSAHPPEGSDRGDRRRALWAEPLTNRDNVCSACDLNFGSVSAFDAHRLGKFRQTGPQEWLYRIRVGLVDVDEDWQSEERFGRRCLEEVEMEASDKWATNSYGQWTLASALKHARARSREAQISR
jgi:hypothetical protein